MAKDVNNKPASNSNNDNTTSSSVPDQQKVPPLRIVLNTSGNQKSSSTAVAVTASQQQQDSKKERQNEAKTDSPLKSGGGKVRIKLGTNKQSSSKSNNSASNDSQSNQNNNRLNNIDESQRVKVEKQDSKEEVNVDYSHLRRITRRSQRTVQTISNEDEESISSMTSTDENQTTTNSTSDNNNASQDTVVSTCASQSNPATVTSSSSTKAPIDSSTSSETPRRYKRRKGETTEFQLSEHDGPFGFQNYKLPKQNSFELYKNIRKQVDKKLKTLSSIHPKTPYGFRDYMLTRGAYLLDGNKLGNGTNLFMNDNGGLRPVQPPTKFHALRHSKINYSVPDRAKVPHSLPVNSPLYNLFFEQEKERHRMRMQHIKEREKLTLAAEQEIVRVHNQAAMAAADQLEPFSVCTMLKHQEIYNYMDADGVTILAAEDQQQEDQAIKEIETRTRRGQPQTSQPQPAPPQPQTQPPAQQQFEQISPPPTRKSSDAAENPPDSDMKSKEDSELSTNGVGIEQDEKSHDEIRTKSTDETDESTETKENADGDLLDVKAMDSKDIESRPDSQSSKSDTKADIESTKVERTTPMDIDDPKDPNSFKPGEDSDIRPTVIVKAEPALESSEDAVAADGKKDIPGDGIKSKAESTQNQESNDAIESSNEEQSASIEQSVDNQVTPSQATTDIDQVLSDDDRKAYNREVFLMQLQEIDDKWEKIRNEMLIRHRNEAESLHAVQKLEWEWKTKEIGVCDIRTTPLIDNSLVPKLNIYLQDY